LVQKSVTIVLGEKYINEIVSGYYRCGEQPGKFHGSIDIATVTGTSVKSVASGEVFFAGEMNHYGNVLIIKHNEGVFSLYAHLSEFKVKKGDIIEQGQEIALSGNTGRSQGPHLHFEFLINPNAKNMGDLLPSNDPKSRREQKVNLLEKEKFEDWFKKVKPNEEPVGLTKEQRQKIESVIKQKDQYEKHGGKK
jgi:murein DD-endopeptidase MepM/ murein hydrolase activator NlpD